MKLKDFLEENNLELEIHAGVIPYWKIYHKKTGKDVFKEDPTDWHIIAKTIDELLNKAKDAIEFENQDTINKRLNSAIFNIDVDSVDNIEISKEFRLRKYIEEKL